MNNRYKIRFTLDGVNVNPAFGPDVEKVYEQEGDRLLFRERLNGALIWARGDEKKVRYQDLEHEFNLLVERMLDTGLYESYITGVFTKRDKSFNEDRNVAQGPVRSIDKYEKILAGLDREFDLVSDLTPESNTLNYKKQPLLQLTFPGCESILNLAGNVYWTTSIPSYNEAELVGFGFTSRSPKQIYIPGAGDMTPDVSGVYDLDTAFGDEIVRWVRSDGIYRIVGFNGGFFHVGEVQYRIVRQSDNEDMYRTNWVVPGPPDSLFITDDYAFLGSHVFSAVINASANQCKAFRTTLYQRYLTGSEEVSGFPTLPIPLPDVGDIVFGYNYMIDPANYPYLFCEHSFSDARSEIPTGFRKFNPDALHWSGLYFDPSLVDGLGQQRFPLFKDLWREYHMVVYRSTFGVNLYQSGLPFYGAQDLDTEHAYKLEEVISLLKDKIDPSILFEYTEEFSQFLFAPSNPVSGEDNLSHFIVPKTNILISNYDNAATRAPITLGQVENLLVSGPNLYWFIDDQSRLRIEHISWFKNGGTYVGENISIDLTTHIVPQLQRAWAYHTRDYRYKGEVLPERFVFGWMDEVSDPFLGSPIEMLSSFVEKGNFKDNKILAFTSDIDYGHAVPEQINKDGFFIIAAAPDVDSDEYTVQYESLNIQGVPYVMVQNGFWSTAYLHDRFWRHNLPSNRILLNGVQTTATTTRRAKEAVVVFPAGIEPPPMELIVTSLGLAEITNMSVNLNSGKATLKVLVDMDFDNPCPCDGYFREASYLMPLSPAEEPLARDILITSILINGQEYLVEPYEVPFVLSVVDIGGNDWVTNLADAINDLGIPNLTSPYPEAGDFANGMTDTARFLRLRFPECAEIQITVTRGDADGAYTPGDDSGLSVRWLTGGHERLDGEDWVSADLLAPTNAFVWADQPRLSQIYVPCL